MVAYVLRLLRSGNLQQLPRTKRALITFRGQRNGLRLLLLLNSYYCLFEKRVACQMRTRPTFAVVLYSDSVLTLESDL